MMDKGQLVIPMLTRRECLCMMLHVFELSFKLFRLNLVTTPTGHVKKGLNCV